MVRLERVHYRLDELRMRVEQAYHTAASSTARGTTRVTSGHVGGGHVPAGLFSLNVGGDAFDGILDKEQQMAQGGSDSDSDVPARKRGPHSHNFEFFSQ